MTSPYSLAPAGSSSMRMSQNASRAWSVSSPSTRNSYRLVIMARLLSSAPVASCSPRARPSPRWNGQRWASSDKSRSLAGGALWLGALGARRPRGGPLQLDLQFDLVPVDAHLGLEPDVVGDLQLHRAVGQT